MGTLCKILNLGDDKMSRAFTLKRQQHNSTYLHELLQNIWQVGPGYGLLQLHISNYAIILSFLFLFFYIWQGLYRKITSNPKLGSSMSRANTFFYIIISWSHLVDNSVLNNFSINRIHFYKREWKATQWFY